MIRLDMGTTTARIYWECYDAKLMLLKGANTEPSSRGFGGIEIATIPGY